LYHGNKKSASGAQFNGDYGDVWVERIPLLAEEGWRYSLIEAGAPGAKREPDRAKHQISGQFGQTLRRSSIEALPYRARASRHPRLRRFGGFAAFF